MERNSTGPYRHLLLGLMLMVTSVPTPAVAQHPVEVETLSPLLPGITLPVQLEHSLHPGKSVVGTPVIARTTQRVPVSPNRYLKRGAELVGEVTASAASGNNLAKLETLSVRFTTLRYRGQTVPINADVLAIANFTDVGDTFAPATGSTDRGNPSQLDHAPGRRRRGLSRRLVRRRLQHGHAQGRCGRLRRRVPPRF